MPRRFQLSYDEEVVRITFKLIHYVDETNHDFIDFGVTFFSNIAAWFLGVTFENDDNLLKGKLFISNDIRMETVRSPGAIEYLNMQTYIDPVIIE